MIFSELMASLVAAPDRRRAEITAEWMQGRSTFGGLSAALCYASVVKEYPDLPPLRSAQVAFIGPTGGHVETRVSILRRGRNVVTVAADLVADGDVTTRCTFAFGLAREVAVNEHRLTAPKVGSPDEGINISGAPGAPTFTQQFDAMFVDGGLPAMGSDRRDAKYWVRHRDDNAVDLAALIAIADVAPPAFSSRYKGMVPVSTMTWQFDILSDAPSTDDGWWLMVTDGEWSENGYSTQDMRIYNAAGQPMVVGRQNVAIFG